MYKSCLEEWSLMRNKRAKREISYENYIEWKLNYTIKGVDNYEQSFNQNKD